MVINKAKSLLVIDKSFFGADSPNLRTGGAEEKERVTKTFIKLIIELNPKKTITLADAYTVFREFSGKQG